MNPARTLADRFRTQRTERIRVDGTEVLSVVEVDAAHGDLVELVIERRRDGVGQGIAITADAPLAVVEAMPIEAVGPTADATDFLLDAGMIDSVLFRLATADGAAEDRHRIRLWNTWMFENACQAWTGNAGIVVEETDVPEGADCRMRLWCSDGLGNASFDDLVATLTIGPDSSDAT